MRYITIALFLGGCTGPALEMTSGFTSVESTIQSNCMACHNTSSHPSVGVVFAGEADRDYAALQPFVADGGAELLERLGRHGGLNSLQLDEWQNWIDSGAHR